MDVKGAKALSERLAAATQKVDARLAAMSAPADLCSDSHKTKSSSLQGRCQGAENVVLTFLYVTAVVSVGLGLVTSTVLALAFLAVIVLLAGFVWATK